MQPHDEASEVLRGSRPRLRRDPQLALLRRTSAYRAGCGPVWSSLARSHWPIEQQYSVSLKDDLGREHFEGRTYPGGCITSS